MLAIAIAALFATTAIGSAARAVFERRFAQRVSTTPVDFYEFMYDFSDPNVLDETPSPEKSKSSYFWLTSGGEFITIGGVGKTIQGETSPESQWRIVYNRRNPRDSDNGARPQNIFRLLTLRAGWENQRQEIYFRIARRNESTSEYKNDSNGVFLMNRYADADNLYYAGLRTDGAAVVKKKESGIYYTLAYVPLFEETAENNGQSAPSEFLLPLHMWIGMRSEVRTKDDGSVSIRFSVDKGRTGKWQMFFEVSDAPGNYGAHPIVARGRGGIRSDFMDVEFDDYRISSIPQTPTSYIQEIQE